MTKFERFVVLDFIIGAGTSAAGQHLSPRAVAANTDSRSLDAEGLQPQAEELTARIEPLIRELGDERFQVREAASTSLSLIGHSGACRP